MSEIKLFSNALALERKVTKMRYLFGSSGEL